MDLFINISTWYVIMGGGFCMIGLLYLSFKNPLKSFWEEHVVAEFPYPDECWDCKKGSCDNCNTLRRYKL